MFEVSLCCRPRAKQGREEGLLHGLLTGKIVALWGALCRSRMQVRGRAAAFSVQCAQRLYSSGRKLEQA